MTGGCSRSQESVCVRPRSRPESGRAPDRPSVQGCRPRRRQLRNWEASPHGSCRPESRRDRDSSRPGGITGWCWYSAQSRSRCDNASMILRAFSTASTPAGGSFPGSGVDRGISCGGVQTLAFNGDPEEEPTHCGWGHPQVCRFAVDDEGCSISPLEHAEWTDLSLARLFADAVGHDQISGRSKSRLARGIALPRRMRRCPPSYRSLRDRRACRLRCARSMDRHPATRPVAPG